MITKNNQLNAAIYVDYENIAALLKKRYGKSPSSINFFPVILENLEKNHGLNIIDTIVYSNFEKKSFDGLEQTMLRSLGLQTRHSSINGKNSGDLELTVDALRTLYKNPVIDVFVIISSDRDIIPLLKAIKYENKTTYLISTKIGFNEIVSKYADNHVYIEDLFSLDININKKFEVNFNGEKDLTKIAEVDIKNAQEVCRLFYNSKVWKKYERQCELISLEGYIQIITKKLKRHPEHIKNDFKTAHCLQYITLFEDPWKGVCIKEGKKRSDLKDC